MKNDLKDLSNPKKFHNPISIKNQDPNILKKMLNNMLVIRKTEQKLAWGKKNKFIGGPVHLGVGQEAIAVGVSQNLKKTDTTLFSNLCKRNNPNIPCLSCTAPRRSPGKIFLSFCRKNRC